VIAAVFALASTTAAGVWCAFLTLAATGADRLITLIVALIGALSSIGTAIIANSNRREVKRRRVIVTKHEQGVTVTDEELDTLAAGEEDR
jgi:hypothetical protein